MLFIYIYLKYLNLCVDEESIFTVRLLYVCHCFLFYTCEWELTPPHQLWWFMFIEACSQSLLWSLTTWLQMVLLWSIWAVAENEASNSQRHLQMWCLGIEARFQRAMIENRNGNRHKMQSGICP